MTEEDAPLPDGAALLFPDPPALLLPAALLAGATADDACPSEDGAGTEDEAPVTLEDGAAVEDGGAATEEEVVTAAELEPPRDDDAPTDPDAPAAEDDVPPAPDEPVLPSSPPPPPSVHADRPPTTTQTHANERIFTWSSSGASRVTPVPHLWQLCHKHVPRTVGTSQGPMKAPRACLGLRRPAHSPPLGIPPRAGFAASPATAPRSASAAGGFGQRHGLQTKVQRRTFTATQRDTPVHPTSWTASGGAGEQHGAQRHAPQRPQGRLPHGRIRAKRERAREHGQRRRHCTARAPGEAFGGPPVRCPIRLKSERPGYPYASDERVNPQRHGAGTMGVLVIHPARISAVTCPSTTMSDWRMAVTTTGPTGRFKNPPAPSGSVAVAFALGSLLAV